MPSLFCIFSDYISVPIMLQTSVFFPQLWYMRTGMIIALLPSFHSRLICIWGEASVYVMTNTRSFMIFLLQVYWTDAFGIWSDTNHYIYILSFMLFLVNWGAWHMQWWPTFLSLQSNLISCTWLVTGKNCCPGFMFFFNFVILCSCPKKTLFLVPCDVTSPLLSAPWFLFCSF
jgi:hypothetical protein